MSNFNLKLNLLKLKNVGTMNVKGKTTNKLCVVIPVDENCIYMTDKGLYLDMIAFELQTSKDEQSHILKQSFSKEKYQAMTEEEKKTTPIIGNMKHTKPATTQAPAYPTSDNSTVYTPSTGDDLPF